MSHNFNLRGTPDSSKLHEYNEFPPLTDNKKFHFGDFSESLFDQGVTDGSIDVSLADINGLNIVIIDNECSNFFIESICQQLDMDGIHYSFTGQEDSIDVEKAVVITLDQQYVSGPRVCIIGAHENNRDDNSDALALAMYTAFRANKVDCEGIFCGRRGFRQDNQGISTRIPTPTEEAISIDSNTSFVTIAFGTSIPSAKEIATIIEDGLGRYVTYISTKSDSDLIYRAGIDDNIDKLADYFKATPFDVSSVNKIDKIIPRDEAIINPTEYNSPVFDENIQVRVRQSEINKSLK